MDRPVTPHPLLVDMSIKKRTFFAASLTLFNSVPSWLTAVCHFMAPGETVNCELKIFITSLHFFCLTYPTFEIYEYSKANGRSYIFSFVQGIPLKNMLVGRLRRHFSFITLVV